MTVLCAAQAHQDQVSQMRFQWHPELHRQLGKERLCFWRMGFSPTYNREAVKEELLELFRALDIHSFAFYEMIGIHDLMLRLWLPTSLTLREFEDQLAGTLNKYGVMLPDSFAVEDMIVHWVWTDGGGELRPVNNGILTQGLSDEVVSKINAGELNSKERTEYEGLNVIAPSSHGKGIKFFIIVTSGVLPTHMFHTQRTLVDEIVKVLRNATSVKEKSLYAGSGSLGEFLVMGKVRTAQFNRIFSELIEPINELGLGQEFRARTYTHVCTTGLVDFVDVLPPWQDIVRDSKIRPVEEYLREEESRTLEVKGTAFVSVDAWLTTGKPKFDNEILGHVLRSIVGLLNAEGGTLVVGALEMRKHYAEATQDGGPLSDYPKFEGRYIVFGIDHDYHVAGSTKDWDAFLQRLGRGIRDRIDPQPTPWVTIERRELMGRYLAVISVREPDSGWFYLRSGKGDPGAFYVRQENETAVLAGSQADEYKRAKDRI